MDTVTVRECVITTLTRRGKGEESSPFRCVTEVWEQTNNGECRLIAEFDPCAPVYDRLSGKFVDRDSKGVEGWKNRKKVIG